MLIRSSTGYPSQFTMGMDAEGQEFLSLVIKATFDFPLPGEVPKRAKVQRPLIMADEYAGAPGFCAPLWETDFAFRKSACDVVAQGAAYAPGEKPTERVRVGLRVGNWTKQFDVVGPRQWRTLGPKITATKPFPFTRLAFGYDTAFGGPDRSRADEQSPPVYADNPYGLGFATVRAGSRIDGLDLPLTEAVDDPVTSPFGAHRPMALGPIPRIVPARVRHAGTYDENWKDAIFPFLPPDFDERYYQCAPPDQQIAPPATGTPVVIVGMTPQGREEFRLPDTDLPVTVFRGRSIALQTTLRPDTLALDCEARQFTLTWRCDTPIRRIITEFSEAWVGPPSRGLARARATGKFYLTLDSATRPLEVTE
ncbi:MAG: DUF2169 domain-containing protein [Paracoccaceae bacterium]